MPIVAPTHQAVTVPNILYGTAWKEQRTEELTFMALEAGFRGVDTANQRKHYYEAGVGSAVARALAGNAQLRREHLFLQTKFTFRAGQDERLPYDPKSNISDQVAQSLASSLEHLQTEYIDAYLLHGPSMRVGIGALDWEAWRSMETLTQRGKARLIGISNVTLDQLQLLFAEATVKPAIVQNRCYARFGWDSAVRSFCRAQGIVYQGFSLLTANQRELSAAAVRALQERTGLTQAELVFAFAARQGFVSLTGTTRLEHMRMDLKAVELTLSETDLKVIGGASG
ncbi:MAG TPA: aldo/keto reductase [Polyangiaceae bacterium]